MALPGYMRQDASGLQRIDQGDTAMYNAFLDERGEMLHAVGGMDVFSHLDAAFVERHRDELVNAAMVCLDGNAPLEGLRHALEICAAARVPSTSAGFVCFVLQRALFTTTSSRAPPPLPFPLASSFACNNSVV